MNSPFDAWVAAVALGLVGLIFLIGRVFHRRDKFAELEKLKAVPSIETSEFESGEGNPPELEADMQVDLFAESDGPMKTEAYKAFNLIILLFIILVYLYPFLDFFFSGVSSSTDLKPIEAPQVLGAMLTQLVFVCLVIGVVSLRYNPLRWFSLHRQSRSFTHYILIVGVVLSSIIITWMLAGLLQFTGINEWIATMSGSEDTKQEVVSAFGEVKSVKTLILLSLMATIVAPVSEEIIFRAYLYPACKRFIGAWAAAFGTSLFFGLIHYNSTALLPLSLLALCLVLSYELFGSLWVPIIIHCLFNAVTVIAQLSARFNI